MFFKEGVFYIICAITWFVLLPVLVVGGTFALVIYATFSELRELLLGPTERPLDRTTAREIARRLCVRN